MLFNKNKFKRFLLYLYYFYAKNEGSYSNRNEKNFIPTTKSDFQ